MADTPVKVPSKYEKAVEKYLSRQVDAYKTPCFDSSLFCAKINEEICNWVKRYEVFDWLWDRAKKGDFEIRISALTIAEVHYLKRVVDGEVKKILPPLYDSFLALISEGRKAGFLTVMEISEKIASRAHSLCGELEILPNDALIVASAMEFGCDVVLAYDGPLTQKTSDRIRLEEPFIYERHMFNRTIEIATEEEQKAYYEARNPTKAEAAPVIQPELRGGNGGNPKSEADGGPASPEPPRKTPDEKAGEPKED